MKDNLTDRDYRNNVPARASADSQGREAHDADAAASAPLQIDGDTYQQPQTAPPEMYLPQNDAAQPQRKKVPTALKVLAALGVGCLALTLAGMLMVGSVLTVGLASCAAALSDDPVRDSKEAKAFIEDPTTNERDLATFDALEGAITSLYEQRARYENEDVELLDPTVLRAAVASGEWPKSPEGYGGTSSATSPQLWVRLAELSQDHLQEETGEQWEVVDFAYPFPDNGPIPVPPKREEGDRVTTWLRCTQGEDEGLIAAVNYYRWDDPARFENTLEDARAERQEVEASYQQLGELKALEGRQYLIGAGDLLVWEQGADDPLRDPATFAGLVEDVTELMGSYAYVVLMVEDAPAAVYYNTLSYDYPNNRPNELLRFDVAKRRLATEHYALHPLYAMGDVLLSGYVGQEETCSPESLRGTLAPTPEEYYNAPWRPPTVEGVALFDAALVDVTAQTLGDVDRSQVIAAWEESTTGTGSESYEVWILVPRGCAPETQRAFCDTAYALLDAAWAYLKPNEEQDPNVHVRLYVIDETTICDEAGETASFAQLRGAAQEDPANLGGYSFEVLLSGWPYASSWDGKRTNGYCEPEDVGGSIARSRGWLFEDAVDLR